MGQKLDEAISRIRAKFGRDAIVCKGNGDRKRPEKVVWSDKREMS